MCKVYEVHYGCSHSRTIELAPCAASEGHMLGPVAPPPVKSTSSHKRNASVHEINLQLLQLSLSQKEAEQALSSSPSKSTSTAPRQPSEDLPDFQFPATELAKTSSDPKTDVSRTSPNRFKIPSISKIAPRPLPPLPVAADTSFFLNSFTGLKPHVGFKVEELIEGATFIPKCGMMCRNGISISKQEPHGLACEHCRLQWMENAKKCGVMKGGCVLKKGEEARRLMDALYESERESEGGWGVLSDDDCEGEWDVAGCGAGLDLSLDDAMEADRICGFDFGFPPNDAGEIESSSQLVGGFDFQLDDTPTANRGCENESSSHHVDGFDFKLDDTLTANRGHESESSSYIVDGFDSKLDDTPKRNRGRESGSGSTIHTGLGLFIAKDSMSEDANCSDSVDGFGFQLDEDSTDVPTPTPTPSPLPSPKDKMKQAGSKAWWSMESS